MIKQVGFWLLKSLLTFLGRRVLDILNDRNLQILALQAVEHATGLDLDGDGRKHYASDNLKAQAAAIGMELATREANLLVEAAYNKLRSIE